YAITGTLSDDTGLVSDYQVTLTNGTLTVTKKAISYTIGDDSHAYGSTANLAGDLPATIATGVNSEDLGITYASVGNTVTAHVSTYAITGTLSDDTGLVSDYQVTLTNGTLTVTKKAISYTIGDDSHAYGSTANLAGDLPATIATDRKSVEQGKSDARVGNTVTAHVR